MRRRMPSAARTEILEKAYTDLVGERDRLRDARAGFTARLGPLPAAAAIVIGLAGSAAGKANAWWIVEAAVLLALLIFVSTVYSGLPPYRLLRAAHQPFFEPGPVESDKQLAFGLGARDPETWLERKIKLEQQICGPLRRTQPVRLGMDVKNLQEALDVERSAFMLVQLLFAEIILVLVAGLAMRGVAFPVQAGIGGGIALATAAGLFLARRRWGFLRGLRERRTRVVHSHDAPGRQ
jgi:hypothetical protein